MVMQTAAFDPTDTTGNRGGTILEYENEEIVNAHKPAPDVTPTDPDKPGNAGDPNTPNTAAIINKMMVGKKALTVAAVAVSAALVTGVTVFAVRRKKEEEEIPEK